jgi:DNA-directed RNA polymerase subunit E'/Rpb7
MQAKYMDKYLGEEFEGIISGVTDWGVFVEIQKMGCEGLLRLAEFRDDYYILEKEHYRIVGERSGKIYSLGDTIRIYVKAVDLSKKTIDFGFAREKNQGQFLGKFHESKPFEIKTKRENSPLNSTRSTGRITSKFKAKGEKIKKSKKKRR